MDIDMAKKELLRMQEKRNNICIELGKGYDWMLVDSLIAINDKITQYESNIQKCEEE